MVKRVALFASFSADGKVAPYILYHVEKLREVCDEVIFVSNSPLSQDSKDALHRHCRSVHERPNRGYDFAAWRDVILKTDLSDFDEILLVNSSIVGPLFSLQGVFDRMAPVPCDFWGLTRNMSPKPHLQSFFLCFRRTITALPAWLEFWSQVEDFADKQEVIDQYELEMTSRFERAGFASASFVPVVHRPLLLRYGLFRRAVRGITVFHLYNRNVVNPTIFRPLELIRKGMPYLKAALLWGDATRFPLPMRAIARNRRVTYDWSLVGLTRPFRNRPGKGRP